MNRIYTLAIACCFLFLHHPAVAQTDLITNISARQAFSLNGQWQYIVDPYETGFYDYRFKERRKSDPEAYWNTDVQRNKLDRKEHGFNDRYTLQVPGDWNSQKPEFLYYEGTIWYKKSFDYARKSRGSKVYLYFGAVNYKADVYLNGTKLGSHKGGFTPFNFLVADSILRENGNRLVVKVDNRRFKDEVPTLNTDWWNYGGITRDVSLIEVPPVFIRDFALKLQKPAPGRAPRTKNADIEGWVDIEGGTGVQQRVQLEIPGLKVKSVFPVVNGRAQIRLKAGSLQLWSPESPKLYDVYVTAGNDRVKDKIGFRTVEAFGKKVLLNGKPLFMRGISIHEQIPEDGRRAYSRDDAEKLLSWAREMNCNMVRLAHYPHNENMTRLADSLGLLVWSEIPVYWTIEFGNAEVFDKAKTQLHEMITRDHNRASVIIWSVGNETPISDMRTEFMRKLIAAAKQQDDSRLISAALEVNYNSGKNINMIDDPLGKYVDLVAFNEYLGWYGGSPDKCRTTNWGVEYDKPLFISETGAGARGGVHADSLTLWSEEFQEWFYKEQTAMLKRMPENFCGISPWILADFRSPKRNNMNYQEGWNRKGLISQEGKKKKAFFVMKSYYDEMERKYK
ncbi:glycoside hydrolase family 2 protein [Arcticibacter sp. MXS-1]|uniref:glycoside hydrolase family 2 protein n=1 Tax=Arcticibacter sp. MXS-1 TaxID=3341726 RepID=UPI0035A87A4D